MTEWEVLDYDDYDIMETANDGSCLFSAISLFLNEEYTAKQLRKEVVKFFAKNANEKHPLFANGEQIIREFVEEQDEAEDERNFEEYLNDMSKENTWGGQPEIMAMGIILQRSILVYIESKNKDGETIFKNKPGFGIFIENPQDDPILLFYNMDEGDIEGTHYEYLRATEISEPGTYSSSKSNKPPSFDDLDTSGVSTPKSTPEKSSSLDISGVSTPKSTPVEIESESITPEISKTKTPTIFYDEDDEEDDEEEKIKRDEDLDKYYKLREQVLETGDEKKLKQYKSILSNYLSTEIKSQNEYIKETLKKIYKDNDLVKNLDSFSDKDLKEVAEEHSLLNLRQRLLQMLDTKLSKQWKYISYPDYDDPEFYKKIYLKKEFYQNIYEDPFMGMDDDIIDKMKEICPSNKEDKEGQVFKLLSYQIFLKNYLNINTPYNGILLFHGLGSGKSCSAIAIAETYKKTFSSNFKKILILVSGQAINDNFRKEVHDIRLGYNQCTFSEYINYYNNDTDTLKITKSTTLINKYYDIDHYQRFANRFNNMYEEKMKEYPNNKEMALKKFHEWIRLNFSNRVVIIDEVHNLRLEDTKESSKEKNSNKIRRFKRYDAVKLMVKYGENIKLILLSGTPMYHEPEEILSLLDLLLINDNYKPILGKHKKNKFFEKNNLINPKRLEELAKGYISFIRKENPLTFPKRLYPEYAVSVSDFIYKKFNILNKFKIEEESRTLIIPCEMTNTQKNSYIKYLYSDPNKITEMGLFDSENYPLFDSKKRLREDNFQIQNNLKEMSTKIYELIKNIKENKTKGLIFIYSNFIKYGIIPIAIALLENGVSLNGIQMKNNKYNNNLKKIAETGLDTTNKIRLPPKYTTTKNYIMADNPICYYCCNTQSECTKKEHAFYPMKFDIIAGATDFKEEIRSIFNGVKIEINGKKMQGKNLDGRRLKILLGSSVLREGINLKNVREIHIMEPWHNKSRVEQVVGRGLRYCSHVSLPPKDRNVTIYQYASVLSKKPYDFKDYNREIIHNLLDKEFEKGQELGETFNIEISRQPRKYPNKKYKNEKTIERRLDLEPLLSYDIIMYKRGEILDSKNKKVEKILKKSAIDCNINRKLNEPEKNNSNCNFDANKVDEKLKKDLIKLDTSTFDNIFLAPYVDYALTLIKNLFKQTKSTIIYQSQIYNIPEFQKEEIFKGNSGKYIIEKALYELTPKKQDLSSFYHIFSIYNDNETNEEKLGYIIPRKLQDNEIVYIFQTIDTELKIRSEFEELPMYHRRGIYETYDPLPLHTFYKKDLHNISTANKRQQSFIKINKTDKENIIKKHYNSSESIKLTYKKEAQVVGYEVEGSKQFWLRIWNSKTRTAPSKKFPYGFIYGTGKQGQKKDMIKIQNLLLNELEERDNKMSEEYYNLKITDDKRGGYIKNMLIKLNELDNGKNIWYRKYKYIK